MQRRESRRIGTVRMRTYLEIMIDNHKRSKVGGAAYTRRAEAAPVESVACADYAFGYAAGFCAAQGKAWSSVSYICNPDGTAYIRTVVCSTQVAPPP